MKRILSGLAALALLATVAIAPAQAQMGPPAEMAELTWQAGTWNVSIQGRMSADQEWTTEKGKANTTVMLAGAALSNHFEGTMMGMPFTGVEMTTFNRDTKQFESFWVDSLTAKFVNLVGNTNAEGVLVLEGENSMMGQDYLMRTYTTKVSNDELKWSMHMSFDSGTTWFEGLKMKYTRAKG